MLLFEFKVAVVGGLDGGDDLSVGIDVVDVEAIDAVVLIAAVGCRSDGQPPTHGFQDRGRLGVESRG